MHFCKETVYSPESPIVFSQPPIQLLLVMREIILTISTPLYPFLFTPLTPPPPPSTSPSLQFVFCEVVTAATMQQRTGYCNNKDQLLQKGMQDWDRGCSTLMRLLSLLWSGSKICVDKLDFFVAKLLYLFTSKKTLFEKINQEFLTTLLVIY